MARPRFFLTGPLPAADGGPLALSAEDVHHASRVARIRPGEEVIAVDPEGIAAVIRVVSIDAHGVEGRIVEVLPRVAEPDVTLVLGVSKGGAFDQAVEGAVEVGVTRILPAITARDVVRLDASKAEKRAERWQRIAHSAAKQSQRAFVPPVETPTPLAELADRIASHSLVLVAWEEAGSETIAEAIAASGARGDAAVAVVVGPEGGLTSEEVSELSERGAKVVTLGPTILRTETAGVVATALVVAELRARLRGTG